MVQNGCAFHILQSEDPNQHLKDFLKIVDLLNLDSENRERTRLRLFQFSLRDQASNWLERLPAGSITTWEDLTTRFLAQFFAPGRTAKLRNDIMIERTGPSPQPQALVTTFEARIRDYMATNSKRMERFENAIFKKHKEINDRMTEMFRLLKELMTSRAPKNVLIREEAKFPVTKNVNSFSLARGEEERSDKTDETLDNTEKPTVTETEIPVMEAERSNEKNLDNNRFNDSLSRARVGKIKGKTYNVLPRGPIYEAILKKKITKKEDIGGNFEIPCIIGGLKHVNALVDQGSDVNVMPYSTYMKLTNEMPTETDIRLSLASHSYIYPLGIAEDVLVEVVEHVYPVDFVI
ncbi:MAK10-like protein [Tanacetum coccineum]